MATNTYSVKLRGALASLWQGSGPLLTRLDMELTERWRTFRPLGFMQKLHRSVIGEPLEITYFRGDTKYTTNVVPIETPRPE